MKRFFLNLFQKRELNTDYEKENVKAIDKNNPFGDNLNLKEITDPIILVRKVNRWDDEEEKKAVFNRLFHPDVLKNTSDPELLKDIRKMDVKTKSELLELSALVAIRAKMDPKFKEIVKALCFDPNINEKNRSFIDWMINT